MPPKTFLTPPIISFMKSTNLSLRRISHYGMALAMTASIAFASCQKKEQVNETTPPLTAAKESPLASLTDREILTAIDEFYEKMKDIKAGKPHSEELTVDDMNFLLEATYNSYAVGVPEHDYETEQQLFSITLPTTRSGNADINEVGKIFWDIKGKLMSFYDGLQAKDKALNFFDTEAKLVGNDIVIDVNAIFRTTLFDWFATSNCNRTFTEPNAHGWKSYPPYPASPPATGAFTIDYSYARGQADINFTTKTLVPGTQNNNKPGAAEALRSYAIAKYRGCNPNSCGLFYVNITSNEMHTWQGGTALTTPVSLYKNMNIMGYEHNRDVWQTVIFQSDTLPGFYVNDTDVIFKRWISTQQMNFYLNRTQNHISARIPAGKTLYDFNVVGMMCLCMPVGPNHPENIYHLPFLAYSHIYIVSSARKIINRPCWPIGWTGLPML